MSNSKYVKFIGDFKDLKGLGWRFQKLYASNYKVYIKEFSYGYTLWIWQRGRELEIDSWSTHSHWLVKNILNDEYKKWVEPYQKDCYSVRLDRNYQFRQELVDLILELNERKLINVESS